MDENSDRLWKMRNPFEILKKVFSKFNSPSEHQAVDKQNCFVQRKGHFLTIRTPETQVLVSKFTKYVTRQDTYKVLQIILCLKT